MKAVNLIPVERRVGAGVGLGRSQGGAPSNPVSVLKVLAEKYPRGVAAAEKGGSP